MNQPEGLTAAATGNAQTTRNGDLFVSWGGLSYFSEFSPSGKLLFNAKLPDGVSTYRGYRLPWEAGKLVRHLHAYGGSVARSILPRAR